MLGIFRRHQTSCTHQTEGRKYRRCQCPVWVDGHLNGKEIHKSLRTRDWQKAQSIVREWETEGITVANAEPITVDRACQGFLQDAVARGLREPTIYKYRLLFRQLQKFAQEKGLRAIAQFDIDTLRCFRATWPNRNIAARKKLEALKSFFCFCWESSWISVNPASKLKPPRTTMPPTLPFTEEEISRIYTGTERYKGGHGHVGRANAQRLWALVVLLRFSGLRIRDAVTLRRDRIVNGKLLLYTAKTGTPVYCPLPDYVVEALTRVQGTSSQFFFWTGVGKQKSCVSTWQRSLRKLFRLSGVPNGHPHRFRHTFATDLLLAGVPLDRVATLLGHTNSKITEKHYAPWIRARQEQLEADVRRVWERNPLSFSLSETPSQLGKEAQRVN